MWVNWGGWGPAAREVVWPQSLSGHRSVASSSARVFGYLVVAKGNTGCGLRQEAKRRKHPPARARQQHGSRGAVLQALKAAQDGPQASEGVLSGLDVLFGERDEHRDKLGKEASQLLGCLRGPADKLHGPQSC